MIRFPVIVCILLSVAAAPKPSIKAETAAETVHFKTADGCLIEGLYLPPSSGSYVFINTHGLGSNRHEWTPLESGLKKSGYGFLSLDLRGHGNSLVCSGRRVEYKSFSPARWAGLSEDIRSAADFLKGRKIPENRLILCGASIGASLSLKAAAEGVKPAGLILLSPGLSYAGIEAEKFLGSMGAVPLLLAASEDDPYAWKSSGYLTVKAGSRGVPAVFRAGPGGHGANMLSAARPELLDYLLDWVQKLSK
jgi:pimeloyl-ACP methyl ester carboxylesterase